ncbi:hypothetical protein E2K93_17200 [Thalassotalea sp. HSM 43]|uniref:hypothetical protein n=1 Tax=Thalassotalea sp. HSM 43 TaxID=2552945 RepID=UPI00108220FA|nr:hypothetical protein [Thalassotalea sp. HSM 43]QBY05994.1 hypothetical protein E2K93_17200 [Thalassotalea sp. HSM 43]
MDFSLLTDAIVLIVCGGLICFFATGRFAPSAYEQQSIESNKSILIIGSIIVFAGIVQLLRHLLADYLT